MTDLERSQLAAGESAEASVQETQQLREKKKKPTTAPLALLSSKANPESTNMNSPRVSD
jgi:hypothetical protein